MSTVQRTPPSDSAINPHTKPEPSIIEQERTTLRELQRLVAERAEAEAEIKATRDSGDTSADSNYRKTRQAISDKHEAMKESARKEDEARRRAIIDGTMAGEAEAMVPSMIARRLASSSLRADS